MSDRVLKAHEDVIKDISSSARKLMTLLFMFAATVACVGSLRLADLASLATERLALESLVGSKWAPLESIYTRTMGLAEQYAADTSTPYAKSLVIASVCLIHVQTQLPNGGKDNSKLAETIGKITKYGNRLSDYNSDIRYVVSAQRRNVAFSSLSKTELNALLRVADFDLTPAEESELESTHVTMRAVLELAKPTGAGRGPCGFLNEGALEILRRHSEPRRLPTLVGQLMLQDLRATGRRGDPTTAGLNAAIESLPAATISGLVTRIGEIDQRLYRLKSQPGLSIPMLNISVTSDQAFAATLIVNLTLVIILYRSLGRLAASCLAHVGATEDTSVEYYQVVLAWLWPADGPSWPFTSIAILLLPTLCAAATFLTDLSGFWMIVVATAIGLALLVVAIATANVLRRLSDDLQSRIDQRGAA